MIDNEQQLKSALETYYADYYRNQLGLRSWEQRVEGRLNEEDKTSAWNLDWIETWLNYSFANKRTLVMGGGTGAETFALQKRGAKVITIEPNSKAISILEAKARLRFGLDNLSTQAVGEYLPYPSDYFDFIYCFAVLEHTQQPIRCIDEMIRVVRHRGWVFVVTPDYRQPYEPHYKIPMPTVLPKWILRLQLRLLGKPVEFLNTLQFVNAQLLRNTFQDRPVTSFQVLHSWPSSWSDHPTVWSRLYRWITRTFGIQKNQYWLLQKLEKPR
jgi:ubiquinone/menaquinone biosynthesis C-methylase UbiE